MSPTTDWRGTAHPASCKSSSSSSSATRAEAADEVHGQFVGGVRQQSLLIGTPPDQAAAAAMHPTGAVSGVLLCELGLCVAAFITSKLQSLTVTLCSSLGWVCLVLGTVAFLCTLMNTSVTSCMSSCSRCGHSGGPLAGVHEPKRASCSRHAHCWRYPD